jgi:UDP-glucose 4-epimerase
MRSLVTGGAGFIGSHVARHCLALGHAVTVLDDLSGGFRDQVPAKAEFVEGSVVDHELVDRLFAERGFDYVYHLAAYAAEGLSPFIRRFNYTNNLIGSVNLINAAVNHEVKCFVFTSSVAAYGALTPPMREDMAPEPEDPYGISKFAVEMDLRAAHEQFGLNYVIFRPHNVYGEHQNLGDRYRNVIGIFMRQLMEGEPLTIFGDGEQTRAFSYIDDVAPQIAKCVTMPETFGEILNIGADQPYTVNELATVVAKQFGANPKIVHLPARNEVVDAYADHSKVQRLFGGQPTVPLEEGVRRMAEWARKAGVRSGREFERVEVEKGMPWKLPETIQARVHTKPA